MRLGLTLLTYNRYKYAERTLRTALDNVLLDGLELQVHIASDGDESAYIDSLREIAGGYGHVSAVTHSNSQRNGYGANYNLAMQTVHLSCEYVLPLEDDWELTRELHVKPLIDQMSAIGLGCARLGYIGFTQDLRSTFRSVEGDWWLELDPKSPEPHVFAGHPRIEARWWSRDVKPWDEGLKPGATEFAIAQREAARHKVGWPLSLIPALSGLFVHIGAERSYE